MGVDGDLLLTKMQSFRPNEVFCVQITLKDEPIGGRDLQLQSPYPWIEARKRQTLTKRRRWLKKRAIIEQRKKISSCHANEQLQCPKCSTSYLHGSHAHGLKLLVGHFLTHHPRMQEYCLSQIREKYSVIIKDAVAGGHLAHISELVLIDC